MSKFQLPKSLVNKTPREAKIEARTVANAKRKGGIAYKFTSPQRRSVPDRLVLLPIEHPLHREIVSRYVKFVENKRPGAVMTDGQKREAKFLTDLGYAVFLVDTEAKADVIV